MFILTDISKHRVLCDSARETESHLFLHCGVVGKIWADLLHWLEGNFIMPPSAFIHWACWDGMASNKKVKKGLLLILHTTIWVIWMARNNCIFNNNVIRGPELVEEIKVLLWRWSLTSLKIPACLYHEMVLEPKGLFEEEIVFFLFLSGAVVVCWHRRFLGCYQCLVAPKTTALAVWCCSAVRTSSARPSVVLAAEVLWSFG
jgi:hypothetical protein